MRQYIDSFLVKIPWIRDVYRRLLWRNSIVRAQPEWPFTIKPGSFADESVGRILFATSTGFFCNGTIIESLLAASMHVRGIGSDVILCNKILPGCLACWAELFPDVETFAKRGPSRFFCDTCYRHAKKMYSKLGVKVIDLGEAIPRGVGSEIDSILNGLDFGDSKKLSNFIWRGYNIGEHAVAGALRFFARGNLSADSVTQQIVRRYFKAALMVAIGMDHLLSTHKYTAVVGHHGIYVPQGIIGEVCRKQNVRVINWHPGYKRNTFIFSHGNSYHKTMISESLENWVNMRWGPDRDEALDSYLNSREVGSNDWIKFHKDPVFDVKNTLIEMGIDFGKPIIGLLSSVAWDARLHYESIAFDDMYHWVRASIDFFSKNPDMQLLIRVHPAEVNAVIPSRQKLLDEIQQYYPKLPANIFIVAPENSLSSYELMRLCSKVIIYNTKMGIELAARGAQVIVAGDAWIKHKGFSVDIKNEAHYWALLSDLQNQKEGLTKDQMLLARKYAYHFFFRRMIPLGLMGPGKGIANYSVRVNSTDDLLPGRDRGLDIICDGILTGKEFIYDPV